MASDLEFATRVEGERGTYRTTLSDEWEIWGPNGGYLAAIALRAVGEEAEIRRPRSFYCHFLSSPSFAAVQVDVGALKRGRRAESFTATMTQDGKPILQALIKTATDGPGYEHQHPVMPDVPPPEQVEIYEHAPPSGRTAFRFWENVERRPIVPPVEDRSPVVREWTRFRPTSCFQDPFVDAARALILLDTYGFPAAYQRYRSWDYLAPNLDTSIWLHQFNPDCQWLLIDHQCTVAMHGLIGVSGNIWDTGGRLLATGSAQLCCVPNRTTR
jgi:acyl-CoA thioesterase II